MSLWLATIHPVYSVICPLEESFARECTQYLLLAKLNVMMRLAYTSCYGIDLCERCCMNIPSCFCSVSFLIRYSYAHIFLRVCLTHRLAFNFRMETEPVLL